VDRALQSAPYGQNASPSAASETDAPVRWQDAFFSALLETDRRKALPLIRRAHDAVESRLADISLHHSLDSAELLDLWNSLTYLGILSECFGNGRGGFLWD